MPTLAAAFRFSTKPERSILILIQSINQSIFVY